ncbi:MAG: carotenoid biosynthesis protein [Verrucomicrobia bacterium]|nr:carotenoid biosynthesis protein [Verrucomicrobiota bacterium]
MASSQNDKPFSLARVLRVPLLVLFLLLWLGVVLLMFLLHLPLPDDWQWVTALFLASATATTLVAMTRRLPAQNVAVAAGLIAFVSGVVQAVGAATGIPFGAYVYTDNVGPRLFDTLPLLMPLVWIVAIINSRGVARLMLRPWRKTKLYGFRVIGLTCLLVTLLDFGLEPFATKVNRFWIWQTPATVLAWHTAPWINFFGWAMTTLLILVVATPWFIVKRSAGQPPDYHPLIVWLSLILLFAAGTAGHQLWWAAGSSVLAGVLVTIFALRGARW